jgi:hypothetical protein
VFSLGGFNPESVDTLLNVALEHFGPVPSTTDPKQVINAKLWYRRLKLRRARLDPVTEKKIESVFQDIYPHSSSEQGHDAHSDFSIPPAPTSTLPKGQVKKEALSLNPTDPLKGRGIVNQGNWCYLDSFVQAACASTRLKEMLESSINEVVERVSKLDQEIIDLTHKRKTILNTFRLSMNEIKTRADKLIYLEDKLTYNLSSKEREEIKKQLLQIKLPEGVTQSELKIAGKLLRKLETKEAAKAGILSAKKRVEKLLTLFQDLKNPDPNGKFSPLSKDSALTCFVDSFKKTESPFYKYIISHSQEDPTELINALCLPDLLGEMTPELEEKSVRQKQTQKADEQKPLTIEEIRIKEIDTPRPIKHIYVPISLPVPVPPTISLQQMFTGFLDTFSVEKDKEQIADQTENKAFFDGDAGVDRKQAFLKAKYDDILIQRSISLVRNPPACLLLSINRFDDAQRKRTFQIQTPFRLVVPFVDKPSPAIYLLRSAVIHRGNAIKDGHFFTFVTDLTSVDAISGEPTSFVCKNDETVYSVSASYAMSQIQRDVYILFYDRVDQTT